MSKFCYRVSLACAFVAVLSLSGCGGGGSGGDENPPPSESQTVVNGKV